MFFSTVVYQLSIFFVLFKALIAETVGDEDAMDLFRHTTELATHVR